MRAARWHIRHQGPRVQVDLDGVQQLSEPEIERLCRSLEPTLDAEVREVVVNGDPAASRPDPGFLRALFRIGRVAMRYGKAVSVRPI